MRVLHDFEDTLAVVAATAETIHKVGKPVFVERSREQYSRNDGDNHNYRPWGNITSEIENGCHQSAGEPSHQWPVFHHRVVALPWRLVYPPERQACEEYECGNDALPPSGLVDVDFHVRSILLYGHFGSCSFH